jgi:hypothetical protein
MFPVSPSDDRLPAKERVLGLTVNGADEAFPFSRLTAAKLPLKLRLGAQHVTVIFDAPSQTAGAVVDGKHVPAYTGYWFAWAAFHPTSAIWQGSYSEKEGQPLHTGNGDAAASGVYGFSGTTTSFGENKMGVVGECIWIYNFAKQKQVASGACSSTKPGEFRVPLAPGDYIVRGPGGDKTVQIKNGQWTKADSIFEIPVGRSR